MANDLFSKILKLRLSSKQETYQSPELNVIASDHIEPILEDYAEILHSSKSRRKQRAWNHRNISKLFSRKSKNKHDRSFDSNINTNNQRESWSEHINTISLGSKTPMASPMVYPKKTFMHFFGRKRNSSKLVKSDNTLKLDTGDNIASTVSISSKSFVQDENITQILFETPDRASDSGKGTGSEGELVPPFSLHKYQLSNEIGYESSKRESPSAKITRLEFFNGTAISSANLPNNEKKCKFINSTFQTSNSFNNSASRDLVSTQQNYYQNKSNDMRLNDCLNEASNDLLMNYSMLIQSPENMSLSLTNVSLKNDDLNHKSQVSNCSKEIPKLLEDLASPERNNIYDTIRPNTLEFKMSPENNIPSNITMSADSDDMMLDFSLGPDDDEKDEIKIEDINKLNSATHEDDINSTITLSKATYHNLLMEIVHLKSQIHQLFSILSFDNIECSPT